MTARGVSPDSAPTVLLAFGLAALIIGVPHFSPDVGAALLIAALAFAVVSDLRHSRRHLVHDGAAIHDTSGVR